MMNIKKFEDFVKETAYVDLNTQSITIHSSTGSIVLSGTSSPIVSKDKYRDIRLNEILFGPAI